MERIVIVSDLHLGLGRNTASGRYHRLEAFFFDTEFGAFVDWLIRDTADTGLWLVLGGDVFDFLRTDDAAGGDLVTVDGMLAEAQQVLAGHAEWVAALGRLLAAGHRLAIVAGNHDPELRIPAMQRLLRDTLAAAAGGPPGDRLSFHAWFVHVPGRLWFEHGNQCDPENAFDFPLVCEDDLARCLGEELDLPLGSWFQRYVFNGFGRIAFQVPATDAHRRYLYWLLLNRPYEILEMVRFHLPLWRRLLAAPPADRSALRARMTAAEKAAEAEVSAASLSPEAIATLRAAHPGSIPPVEVVSVLVQRATRYALMSVAGLLAASVVLSTATLGVLGAPWPLPVRGLLLAVVILLVAGAFWGGVLAFWVYGMRPQDERRDVPRRYAALVARTVGVPVVVMGHFHGEDKAAFDDSAVYLNTGTWIPVWHTGDSLRPPVQHTFADLKPGRPPQLRYFDAARDLAPRVVLLDE